MVLLIVICPIIPRVTCRVFFNTKRKELFFSKVEGFVHGTCDSNLSYHSYIIFRTIEFYTYWFLIFSELLLW
jgi:hypothetical protein